MAGTTGRHCSRTSIVLVIAAALAATAGWAYYLAPWYDAGPVPVRLRLAGPFHGSVTLYGDATRSEPLPLVPCEGTEGGDSQWWLGELPPRLKYQLSIDFSAPTVPQELVLVDVRKLERPILHVSGSEVWRQDISAGAATARLSLSEPVSRPDVVIAERFLIVWGLIIAILAVVSLIVLAVVRFAAKVRSNPDEENVDSGSWQPLTPIWCVCLAGLAFHVAVTALLPALYNPFDPLAYFHKAVWLLERGTYTTDTPSWEIDRLPGYPLFLAFVLKIAGYHLKAITMTQGALFGASLLALCLSLRRWISPWFTATAAALTLLSPAGLQHTLSIGTESLFATLCVLALAAYFEHCGTSRPRSTRWLAAYSVLTLAATFVRPNGIVLLAAVGPACLAAAIRIVFSPEAPYQKVKLVAACSLRYAVPFLLIAAGLGLWAGRNQREHGMRAPTSMVGVSIVEGQMQGGTFDIRALSGSPRYAIYLRDKFRENYAYSAWNLRGTVYDELTNKGLAFPAGFSGTFDRELREIAARSEALSPWQLKPAGVLRSLAWALRLPGHYSYTRNRMWCDPFFFGNHPDATETWRRFCTTDAFAKLGKPLTTAELQSEQPLANWALDYARLPGDWHRRGYRMVLIAGCVSGACLLLSNSPWLATPWLVFLANLALNSWLMNIQGRYILAFEFALAFQTAIGAEFLIRSLRAREANQLLPSSSSREKPAADFNLPSETRAAA